MPAREKRKCRNFDWTCDIYPSMSTEKSQHHPSALFFKSTKRRKTVFSIFFRQKSALAMALISSNICLLADNNALREVKKRNFSRRNKNKEEFFLFCEDVKTLWQKFQRFDHNFCRRMLTFWLSPFFLRPRKTDTCDDEDAEKHFFRCRQKKKFSSFERLATIDTNLIRKRHSKILYDWAKKT